jgi:bifunctional non-homologous end joining protein LigD
LITYVDLAELTIAPTPFKREGWIFELKYDGFRMLAAHRGGRAELVSRRGNHFADRFPEIATEMLKLPNVVLDAELVVLDPDGKPNFERLMQRSRRTRRTRRISIDHGARTDPAVLFAFDVLEFDGEDVRQKSLLDRKALLDATLPDLERIRLVGHIDDGLMLYKVADGLGLEGIVAKRAIAPYPRGKSGDWVKIKTAHGRHVDEGRRAWNERL